ncbi:MAG: beta-ketoacyl synthase chain length factor [Pseudomonadota bacterium]
MLVRIAGIGAWGPGFSGWEALAEQLAAGTFLADGETAKPVPECIPPRERRRAPLAVKLAVVVADEACRHAGIEPAETAAVFASGMGDMDITQYMCETLASDMPAVSPTKFHNSVHNAPVGYWTISQRAGLSSNAVAGFDLTVPASLLEAAIQCATENVPVLWASQDIAAPGPFQDIAAIDQSCAFALVLMPGEADGTDLHLNVNAKAADWPTLAVSEFAPLYESNPTARLIPLLELLAGARTDTTLSMPLNEALALEVQRP